MKRTHWTSGSARSPCTVGALAPAAPTSRSSRSSWRSSWRGSLWAGGQRGFLSPPRCPDQTATLWSSSVSPDWPEIRKEHARTYTLSLLVFLLLYKHSAYDTCIVDTISMDCFCTSKIFSVCSRFRRDAVEVSSCSCLRRNRTRSSFKFTSADSLSVIYVWSWNIHALEMRKCDLEYEKNVQKSLNCRFDAAASQDAKSLRVNSLNCSHVWCLNVDSLQLAVNSSL